MNFDKINITLYDLIGYLLPGFVFLGVLSVGEATFFPSHILTVQAIKSNPVVFVIVAYYLGHFCHTVGSSVNKISKWVKTLLPSFLCPATPSGLALEPTLMRAIEEEVCSAYNLQLAQLGSSEAARENSSYLLADSWTLIANTTGERDTFQAREGFFKASSVSFAAAGILFGSSWFKDGATINQTIRETVKIDLPTSLIACGFCLVVAFVFARRTIYFSCIRRNQTRLLFLASRRNRPPSSP